MKVTITLDDNLMERLDSFADENYMSRSGFISLACTQFLNISDVNRCIKDMAFAMRKIADKGEIDEETRIQLEDFERISNMLVAGK